jgi:hemoglobin
MLKSQSDCRPGSTRGASTHGVHDHENRAALRKKPVYVGRSPRFFDAVLGQIGAHRGDELFGIWHDLILTAIPHLATKHPIFQPRGPADTINGVEENEIYSAIGQEGFERLAAGFYRQVPGDDILGPIYPADDLPGAEQRLRDFLIGRFGGPPVYIEQRGHPRLRMRHAPFSIGQAERDRWVQLMIRAMDEAALPEEVHRVLKAFFESTATFLLNQPGG